MRKYFSFLMCVVLALAMVLTGCGSSSDDSSSSTAGTTADTSAEKVNIKVSCWGIETDPNSLIIKDAVKRFNENNNVNATATVEFTEQEQYKTKITAALAANQAPDVFNTWASGFLKPFVQSGKILDLTDALDNDTEWKGRYVNGILSPLSFDNKVYAVPLTQTVVCLFYNKEIFNKYGLKEPATYADLKNIITVLNKNGVTPFALGNKAPWVGAMYGELLANRIGGSEPFNKVYDGSGTWNDPSFIKAGKIMNELVQMNAFPKGFNALDNDPSREMFVQGKAAMHVMGSWAIQQVENKDFPTYGKLDVCKFPSIEGGTGDANNWLGQPDQSFAISAKTKNKEAALAFIKTLSDAQTQTALAEKGNLISTNTEVDQTKLDPMAVKVATLQKDMKELFIFYDVGLGAEIGNEFNNTIQAITTGKSPEEQFKKLQTFTEQSRANN